MPSGDPTWPDDAVALAAERIEACERVSMQQVAEALGVSRVTLFRRVGSREDLLAAALWQLAERDLVEATRRWEADPGRIRLRSAGIGRNFNVMVANNPGVRHLLDQEPAVALRVLTDPRGPVQSGVVAWFTDLLERDVDEHDLDPTIDPGDLAFALVRLGEAFIYADVLADRTPDVRLANRVQRALVEGSWTRPPRRA